MEEKKEKKGNGMSVVMDVLLSLALLGGIGYGGYYLVSHGKTVEQRAENIQPLTEATTEEETTEPAEIYDYVEVANQEIYDGNLVLVNYEFPFQGSEENLVSIYQVMLENSCHSFGTKDGDVKVQKEYAEKLLEMFDAFYQETYDTNVIVQSGYRSSERQQELYDEDLAKTGLDYSDTVAKAGYSEHQTGLCVDLSLYQADYDGTGIYSWINEHCTEYGIMLRYPENKVDVTRISYEPWHYRYVGVPHAEYITQNGICLEEYMTLLYGYPYDGEHLQFTDKQNQTYEIYYYPEDTTSEATKIPVPKDKEYTISGNNQDGFIVTVKTAETELPTETEETEETKEIESTDTETETNS